MARPITAKHLGGTGDLVVVAPIRTGFIDAFESVTFESRLKIVMKALFKLRSTAREYALAKPFADVAERIQMTPRRTPPTISIMRCPGRRRRRPALTPMR